MIIAAIRFFRMEKAMLKGRANINGWDLWLAAGLLFVVCFCYSRTYRQTHEFRYSVDSPALCSWLRQMVGLSMHDSATRLDELRSA